MQVESALKPSSGTSYGLYRLGSSPEKEHIWTGDEIERRQRVLRSIPALSGNHDFISFQVKDNPQFINSRDEGDFRLTGPHRADTNPIDTVRYLLVM